jgi:hypothetical protein
MLPPGTPSQPRILQELTMIAYLLTHPIHPRDLFLAVLRAMLAYWPLLLALGFAIALAAWCAARWLRGYRDREAADAVWLQIAPPARLPRRGGETFAMSVAGMLHRTRRFPIAARHLVCEFVATDAGVSAGIWVPPALSERTVTNLIVGAWPGARVTPVPVPRIDGSGGVAAREISPRAGEWHPLIDPGSARAAIPDRDTPDPLNQVLGTLEDREPGETVVVQVIVAAQHTPSGLGGVARAGGLAVVNFMQFLLTPHSSTPPRTPVSTTRPAGDPVATARRHAIAAKKANGPHLRVTVRAAVTGPIPARYRRGTATRIAGGFDPIATAGTGLLTRRVHRPA